VLASWADAIDNSRDDVGDVNSALVDSDDLSSDKASSDCSDPEAAAFLADADFAVAVARAAEMSGMTVVGSTVLDPSTQREKGARMFHSFYAVSYSNCNNNSNNNNNT